MDLDAPPRRPAVTLTFDLQNLTWSSVWLVVIPCKFHQDCSSSSWDLAPLKVIYHALATNRHDQSADQI